MPPVRRRPSNPCTCGLQEMVNKMNDSIKKRGMKVNLGKTKVVMFEEGESTTECDTLIEGEKVKQVKEFVYLGNLFIDDGKYDRDIERRVNAGNKAYVWVWQKKNESKINAVETQSLHSMCGVSQKDRCRNSDIREQCDLKEDVVTRVERSMLRWFGHMERMNESKLKNKSIEQMCDEKVGKGRPRKSYADHIDGILKNGSNFKLLKPTNLHESIDGCQ
ncbi:hypothetical protein EVAR_63339_1 [Eumeta japonica]|uniref:Reverse transcriptase domain-containing protein n=1 Tax=Eumeta variegata TaxID=151549 RepID=A0A4C1YY83_EUMVA|nr:hypothetical protein EVAR_63339_1 [Eumeta japonica]